MGALRVILLAWLLVLTGAGTLSAQSLGQIVSPIATLDRDRLFKESLYGQRISGELAAATAVMATETRDIEASLAAEEKNLAEQRATLDPTAFRDLAQAFDEKVQKLRVERDQARNDLQAKVQAAQYAFFNKIGPILGQLIRERGAVLILDRNAIVLQASDIDITDAAIQRLDEVLGDGANLAPTDSTDQGNALDTITPPAETGTPDTTDGTPDAGNMPASGE